MTFSLNFNDDSDAFEDGNGGWTEISRILGDLAVRIDHLASVDGVIRDFNGNTIGTWIRH